MTSHTKWFELYDKKGLIIERVEDDPVGYMLENEDIAFFVIYQSLKLDSGFVLNERMLMGYYTRESLDCDTSLGLRRNF